MIRRDHTFAPRCLIGSGFPIPLKGSRVTASTRSMTLSATRRLVSIQKRRSSLNSSWKKAARLESESLLEAEAKLRSQGPDGFRGAAILESSLEGLK